MSDKYAIIRVYLDLILEPDPFFQGNGSHFTLSRLNGEFGKEYIQSMLDRYFAEFGSNGQKDKFNKYRG